jgi:hypothetical protein
MTLLFSRRFDLEIAESATMCNTYRRRFIGLLRCLSRK